MGGKTREPGNEVDKLNETLPTVRAPLRSHTCIDSESYFKSLTSFCTGSLWEVWKGKGVRWQGRGPAQFTRFFSFEPNNRPNVTLGNEQIRRNLDFSKPLFLNLPIIRTKGDFRHLSRTLILPPITQTTQFFLPLQAPKIGIPPAKAKRGAIKEVYVDHSSNKSTNKVTKNTS